MSNYESLVEYQESIVEMMKSFSTLESLTLLQSIDFTVLPKTAEDIHKEYIAKVSRELLSTWHKSYYFPSIYNKSFPTRAFFCEEPATICKASTDIVKDIDNAFYKSRKVHVPRKSIKDINADLIKPIKKADPKTIDKNKKMLSQFRAAAKVKSVKRVKSAVEKQQDYLNNLERTKQFRSAAAIST